MWILSQSELRLPLLQVVSNNKSFSVGVQSPTEINAPRGCAVILRRICQLSLTRITHQVSRAFDLNCIWFCRFCRIDSDSCKMRNPKDGFGCGDCYSNNHCIDFFLDHGTDHWIHRNNRLLKQQDMDVFNFIRNCDRSILAVLFQSIAAGRCQ